MQIRIPGLPHPVYVTKANRAQEPNQFEPLFRYGSHYALFDRAAGFETPNTPLGTPILLRLRG